MKKIPGTNCFFSLKKYILPFFLAFSLMIAHVVNAQSRWSGTLRGAANFPVQDLGIADLKTGFGFEGTISYRFMPHLSVNTGWGYHHFSSSKPIEDIDYEETGYSFGLQFLHPIKNSKINYIIGGSGIYNHIEVENKNGDLIGDSGHGLGWQLETGLSIPVSKRLSIQPTIRYRSLTRTIAVEELSSSVELNYLSAGAGFCWKFK